MKIKDYTHVTSGFTPKFGDICWFLAGSSDNYKLFVCVALNYPNFISLVDENLSGPYFCSSVYFFETNIKELINKNLIPLLTSPDKQTCNFGIDILFNKCKYLKELKKNLEKINKLDWKEKSQLSLGSVFLNYQEYYQESSKEDTTL